MAVLYLVVVLAVGAIALFVARRWETFEIEYTGSRATTVEKDRFVSVLSYFLHSRFSSSFYQDIILVAEISSESVGNFLDCRLVRHTDVARISSLSIHAAGSVFGCVVL